MAAPEQPVGYVQATDLVPADPRGAKLRERWELAFDRKPTPFSTTAQPTPGDTESVPDFGSLGSPDDSAASAFSSPLPRVEPDPAGCREPGEQESGGMGALYRSSSANN